MYGVQKLLSFVLICVLLTICVIGHTNRILKSSLLLFFFNRNSIYFSETKAMFRFNPSNFVRFTGDFLKISLKTSSVISSQSDLEKFNNSGLGLYFSSW